MSETGVIYCLTSPSGRKYVGQTRMRGNRRMVIHKAEAKRNCATVLGNAIRKYGMEAFKQETLCKAPVSELNRLEQRFIRELGTLVPNGYNLTTGGGAGRECSDGTRKKMSESRKGEKNPNFGKKHSKETLEKILEARKGWKHSEESKQKISKAIKEKRKHEPVKHGTLSTYNRHKCKCEECLEVGRAYYRELYEKRKISVDNDNFFCSPLQYRD